MEDMLTVLILVIFVAVIVAIAIFSDKRNTERAQAHMAHVAPHQARIVCPHCQTAGYVTGRPGFSRSGIDGGKLVLGFFTAGISLLFTGLSNKNPINTMDCGNCAIRWTIPR